MGRLTWTVRGVQEGEARVLTRVSVREGGKQEGRSRGHKAGSWKGVQGPGIQATSRSWKSEGTDSLLGFQEGKQPCQPLDLSPISKILTSRSLRH